MRPSPQNLQRLDRADLERLIESRVPEDETLEYKQAAYQRPEEFCKDISAMANTLGGVILLGIREGNHLPVEVLGIDRAAEEQQRLTQAAEANIRPRLSLAWKSITLGDGRDVLACGTQRSRFGPHMNHAGNDKRFHKRANEITTVMDERELRAAFLQSRTQEEIVLDLHREHVEQVWRAPQPGPNRSSYVLDVIPVPIEESRFDPGDDQMVRAVSTLHPALGTNGHQRISFDGWVCHSTERPDMLRLDRSGVIRSHAVVANVNASGQAVIPSHSLVQDLFDFLRRVRQAYTALGVAPPMYLCWTITRSRGMLLGLGAVRDPLVVDVDRMEFPPILWESLDTPTEVLLRPWLDRLWQAFGLLGCSFYDETGEFQIR